MYIIDYKQNETGKSVKVMTPVTSEAEYRALRDSQQNVNCLTKVRAMYEDYNRLMREDAEQDTLKRRKDEIDSAKGYLVQMNYSCIPEADMLLKGCRKLSPWVGMDVDIEPSNPDFGKKMAEAPQRIMAMKEQLGLGMLERSAGKGYHVAFRRHLDMSQEENLRWASQMIGCMFDERAKDHTRVFFTTSASADDLLYLSPDMFLPEANQPVETVGSQSTATVQQQATAATVVENATTPAPADYNYMGFPINRIIDKYWELYNDGKTPCEGGRNTLTYELTLNLRCICDFSTELLLRVVPRYDGLPEAEWRQTITNANNEARKGMTFRMRKVIDALKAESKKSLMPWGMSAITPPLYTGRLPESLRKITATTPQHLKTIVSEGVFGALATHLHGVTFTLIDGKVAEPAIMQILINRQSRGKGSIDEPIEAINADLEAHDVIDRQREQEWKQGNMPDTDGKKSKKKKPRPRDIYIQCCQSDMTSACFVQRLIDGDANGQRPIFIQMQELDEIYALFTNGKNDVSRIIRKGFDRKKYGQERVSTDSITGVAPLRLNFTAATTPIKAQQICSPWVNDGTLSRCNLLTVDPGPRPKYKPITQQYRDSLAPYIARLNNAEGLIRCRKAEQLAERLRDELDDEYAQTDSESLNIFSSRAITIAYFKAMILYIMAGEKWSRDIETYVEWSLKRDLWVKMHFFGKKLEDEIDRENNLQVYHPKSIIEVLPNPFSEDTFKQKRQEMGLKGDHKEHLKKMKQRNKIAFDDTIGMYVIVAA